MRDANQTRTGQRHAYRNLKSVGTVGTVGTASNGAAYSRSHLRERSGNGWEHNSFCEHKSAGFYSCAFNLFPLENAVGTRSPSGTHVVTGCSHVPTVPTFYERGIGDISGDARGWA